MSMNDNGSPSRLERLLDGAFQKRPGMYFGDNTLSAFRPFLDGMLLDLAAREGGNAAELRQMRRFNTYIRDQFGVTGWQDWDRIIDFHAHNNELALTDFFGHWNRFVAEAHDVPETRLHVDTCVPKLLASLAVDPGTKLEGLLNAIEADHETFLRRPNIYELSTLIHGLLFDVTTCGRSELQSRADWKLHAAFRAWMLARYNYNPQWTGSWCIILAQRGGETSPHAIAKFFRHWHEFLATRGVPSVASPDAMRRSW